MEHVKNIGLGILVMITLPIWLLPLTFGLLLWGIGDDLRHPESSSPLYYPKSLDQFYDPESSKENTNG